MKPNTLRLVGCCIFAGAAMGIGIDRGLLTKVTFTSELSSAIVSSNPGDTVRTPSPGLTEAGKYTNLPYSPEVAAAERSVMSTDDGLDLIVSINDDSHYSDQAKVLQLISAADSNSLSAYVSEIADKLDSQPALRWVYRALLQRWAEIDFVGALAFIEPLISNGNRHDHLGMVLHDSIQTLASFDAEHILQWLDSVPAGPTRDDVQSSLYAGLATTTPLYAMSLVTGQDLPENKRADMMSAIVTEWAMKDPAAAMDWVKSHAPANHMSMLTEQVVSRWIEIDADAALGEIQATPDSTLKAQQLARVAYAKARVNPEAAYQWANTLQYEPARRMATTGVLQEISYQDPERLMQLLNGISDEHERRQLLVSAGPSIAQSMATTDPEQAMQWTDSLPETIRLPSAQSVMYTWINMSPDDAMAWLDNLPDSVERSAMDAAVAESLPRVDLDRAMQTFPTISAEERPDMAYEIVDALYRSDPDSAWQWVEQLPSDSSARVAAQTQLIMLTSRNDPEKALAITTELDRDTRAAILPEIIGTISDQYPDLITDWMASASLESAEREELEQIVLDASEY